MKSNEVVLIGEEEMLGAGYPPFELEADLRNTNLMGLVFSRPGCIFAASGPPGAPCGMAVYWKEEAGEIPMDGEAGPNVEMTVAGRTVSAQTWTEQTGPWKMPMAGAMIDLQECGVAIVVFTAWEDENGNVGIAPMLKTLVETLRV